MGPFQKEERQLQKHEGSREPGKPTSVWNEAVVVRQGVVGKGLRRWRGGKPDQPEPAGQPVSTEGCRGNDRM